MKEVFKAEVGFGLLGDFLLTLNEVFRPEDAEEIVGILSSLSQTKRFDLSVQFLDKNEKEAVSSIFTKVRDSHDTRDSASKESLQSLMTLYSC